MKRRHFALGVGASVLPMSGCAASPFASVDRMVAQAVEDGQIPGAILVIGHRNIVVHRSVTGHRASHQKRKNCRSTPCSTWRRSPSHSSPRSALCN